MGVEVEFFAVVVFEWVFYSSCCCCYCCSFEWKSASAYLCTATCVDITKCS